MWADVLILFINLHAADGSLIQVNPASIVSMHGRRTGHLFTENANCLLNMADGKYVTVQETCEEVFKLIEEER